MKIILASESLRRIEMLTEMGLKFEVRKHRHTEEHFDVKSPFSFVKLCSKHKAESAVSKKDELIIGADTIVYIDKKIIGKPVSRISAKRMITLLSGKKHTVYTGLTLIYKGEIFSGVQKTDVFFRRVKSNEIDSYLDRAEYMDKAGAYAVQEEASLFIEKISGDFFNVIGFPLILFSDLFEKATGEALYKTIWRR